MITIVCPGRVYVKWELKEITDTCCLLRSPVDLGENWIEIRSVIDDLPLFFFQILTNAKIPRSPLDASRTQNAATYQRILCVNVSQDSRATERNGVQVSPNTIFTFQLSTSSSSSSRGSFGTISEPWPLNVGKQIASAVSISHNGPITHLVHRTPKGPINFSRSGTSSMTLSPDTPLSNGDNLLLTHRKKQHFLAIFLTALSNGRKPWIEVIKFQHLSTNRKKFMILSADDILWSCARAKSSIVLYR